MNTDITQLACKDFVDVLASAAPTPGGGGAAALVGAVGVALGNMVGSLTIGKKKYADVEGEICSLKEKANELQDQLIFLVEQDAQVFAPLAQAYSLPTETEKQRKEKACIMEQRLYDAACIPLQVMECCIKAMNIVERFAQIGSALAISDAGCAVACIQAALNCAVLNVLINTKAMKDRSRAEVLNTRAQATLDEGTVRAGEIFKSVREQLN